MTQPSLFPDRKPIPTRHPKDSLYATHCVDCGKLLAQWERDWNGIDRPERGRQVVDKQREKAFGGYRCLRCHKKLEASVEDYYQ